ncbi:F390 synthetase-related protein [Cupriavidus basilensis]|uniref:F390 synthetase-related protein n=1 Tax=Cupriavidus basilensis TaxID=68895 RepID=UPI000751A6A6|nr:F390 synthetase-related protein [Cupriavidus basilensis]
MRLHRLLWAYANARLRRHADRAALERHQAAAIDRFARTVLRHSPWFRPYADRPRHTWPLMDKQVMLAHFDEMNTAGLKLQEVLACAMRAEHDRDFSATLGGYSVGLSSGTSGSRGVFVASADERATWAGIMLAKMLPRGLMHRERVALFLRANNRLYSTVRTPWLSFVFYDLFQPLESLLNRLEAYRPTIIVAPAQVLRAIVLGVHGNRAATLRQCRAVAVAEVLEPLDRALLGEAFASVGEVYQATEGFLGATCPHGTMHLNEEFVHIEPQWLDESRFVPIITDFTRSTQPIVRYRLDDVLTVRHAACPCGNPARAIERIEGRCDDMLVLPGIDGVERTVFADVCARALAQALPMHADYRLIQTGSTSLALSVDAGPGTSICASACRQHLEDVFARLGVATQAIEWTVADRLPNTDFMLKRRRITRAREPR